MKKILALVLALALCMTAVAVFAETPAIDPEFKIGVILLMRIRCSKHGLLDF